MNPRIIAGKYKNKQLLVPESARPITDRVKRSMFDSLSEVIEGAKCLDLFAGSGSIGIEALSRGAESCTFVENDIEAIELLEKNLKALEITDQKIENQNCETYISKETSAFDLVFIDPPFTQIENFDLSLLKNVMTKNSFAILKAEQNQKINFDGFEVVKESKIGINVLYFFTNSD